tara:strand:+ start:948 stop:1085 length:138 start_codon:yes stop_codon:yes gene_type:complete
MILDDYVTLIEVLLRLFRYRRESNEPNLVSLYRNWKLFKVSVDFI